MERKSWKLIRKQKKALLFFRLQETKVKESWISFQIQNKRRQNWLQKWVSTVGDAILSSSLVSNQTGHFPKKHLQTTKALNAFPWIKVQIQKWMTRESITCKHKTNEYRGEVELHNTLTCQLRSGNPKHIWNRDQRRDWQFQKYYSSYQTKSCSKKSNWFKYKSQGLILKKLKCQTRFSS